LLAGVSTIAAAVLAVAQSSTETVAASPPIWVAGPGLYRSDDGGATVKPVDLRVDNPPDPKLQISGAASAVAVDPQNPNNIYVLGATVGAAGAIYRSTDQGKTWSVKRSLLDSYPPALDGSDPTAGPPRHTRAAPAAEFRCHQP
jgi:photosystem II stability/assembly factor-like uncharacterized protein